MYLNSSIKEKWKIGVFQVFVASLECPNFIIKIYYVVLST